MTPINLVADLNGINCLDDMNVRTFLDEKVTSFNFVDDTNR
jgi:hypothetical protein